MTGYLKTPWVRQVIAALGIGVIAAVIGPFGTFLELTFPARLLYWVPMVAVGWVQWNLLDRALGMLSDLGAGEWLGPWWVRMIVLCFVTPIPLIFEIVGVRALLGLSTGTSWTELYAWTAGIALLIWASVDGVILWARVSAAEKQSGIRAAAHDCSVGEFIDRLPMEKRGHLLCLKTEDHYLRVFTDRGEELILLRLKDALKELESHDGRRVHRSYWVSRAALSEVRRDRRKTRLILTNGLEVPVSETYLPELRSAGWLG